MSAPRVAGDDDCEVEYSPVAAPKVALVENDWLMMAEGVTGPDKLS